MYNKSLPRRVESAKLKSFECFLGIDSTSLSFDRFWADERKTDLPHSYENPELDTLSITAFDLQLLNSVPDSLARVIFKSAL